MPIRNCEIVFFVNFSAAIDLSSNHNLVMQRRAFPQFAAIEPSWFIIMMEISACFWSKLGKRQIIWSQPTPSDLLDISIAFIFICDKQVEIFSKLSGAKLFASLMPLSDDVGEAERSKTAKRFSRPCITMQSQGRNLIIYGNENVISWIVYNESDR